MPLAKQFGWVLVLAVTVLVTSGVGYFMALESANLFQTKAVRVSMGNKTNKGKTAREPTILPGPLFNATLFAWGGRVTMVSEFEPHFELLMQGSKHIRERKKQVEFYHNINVTMLNTTDFYNLELYCYIPLTNETSKVTVKKNFNIDPSIATFLFRFLCPLSMEAIRSKVIKLELVSPTHGSAYFEIDRHTDSIGLVGPNNTLPIAFHAQPKVKYQLCSGGIRLNALHLLPEYLQHHIRMGFQHFVIGIDVDRDPTMFNATHELIGPLIEAGVVALYTFSTPRRYVVRIEKNDYAKFLFNEACISYAKGRSEYVANWDLDEFWMPAILSPNSSAVLDPSLSFLEQQLARFAVPATCPDWCFISFPSLYVWEKPYLSSQTQVKQIAREFPFRPQFVNYVWQKSIAKSKNVFNSGSHSYGTCLFNGTLGADSDGKANGCWQRVPELGEMHHFRALFRNYNLTRWAQPDEYSLYTLKVGYAVNVTNLITGERFVFNRVPGERFEPPLATNATVPLL
ncbi:hypothetical protein BASA81_012617 [Batrachochytrium salamandrivorans]|nr:hypothetical protein BASA81_012617 [Batrachochytrium salamandrivorans]